MSVPVSPAWQWVRSNEALAQQCLEWQQETRLGLDTEFVRETTFYPLPGLIQLASVRGVWLIDPLEIDQWQPFAELLLNPAIEKILHACGEDLELLQQLTGVIPVNLFDTQIAAAYAGIGFSMGFQRLMANLLEVELDKQETRSDWRARPLSEKQCQYAADDAWYLLQLREQFDQRFDGLEKLAWLLEDCADLSLNARQAVVPELAWRSVKLAWKLRPQQLAVLRVICRWREEEAVSQNRPRNRILAAAALFDLACYQPDNLVDLGRNRALKPSWIRQRGQVLLDLIGQGQAVPESEWPQALEKPLPPEVKPWMHECKAYVADFAEQHQIAAEVLLRKKPLHALMRGGMQGALFTCPEQLQGWRRQILIPKLLQRLNDFCGRSSDQNGKLDG